MKILHLAMHENTGAGRAAMRLHLGLLQEQIDSSMFVFDKSSDLSSVIKPSNRVKLYKLLQTKASAAVLEKLFKCQTTFSINASPSLIHSQIDSLNADILNFHWIGREFLSIEELKTFKVPLVWTLQDMWPFTGGCHYNDGCTGYTEVCGACPQLASHKKSDLSHWVWQRKAKAWKNLNLTIVTPSTWMAECARKSSLFRDLRIEVVPFCLDTQQYRPVPQATARELLGLPQDKQLVLFGALSATTDPRKGFQLLLPALQNLSQASWGDRIELVVFGASQPKQPIDLGFKTHYLGNLHDDVSLRLVYSAADVMIVPSTQESFGQTASESLACGTPVVAFNATGLMDIVDHQQNGYLAKPYEVTDLARGIAWVLEDRDRFQKLQMRARKKAVQAFSLESQAQQYISLYNHLLTNEQSKQQFKVRR